MAYQPPRLPPPRFTPPRIRLPAIRPADSIELDHTAVRVRGGGPPLKAPPLTPWHDFYNAFRYSWKPGEHVALVGRTGSGKTTLARTIIPLRTYAVVAATKIEDDSLYKPLERVGFKLQDRFDPEETRDPHVIFRPPLRSLDEVDKRVQQRAFYELLQGVFETGRWEIYLDEVRYLTEELRLETPLNTLWLQGRSLGVTIVAATQRPVSVPLNMFEQATHLFAFRLGRLDDRKRIAEYAGDNGPLVEHMIARLPKFEVLYLNTVTDELVRTRVA